MAARARLLDGGAGRFHVDEAPFRRFQPDLLGLDARAVQRPLEHVEHAVADPGVDGDLIARSVTVPTIFEPHFTSTPARVREVAGPDDVILTIGAGSVTMLADEILRELG